MDVKGFFIGLLSILIFTCYQQKSKFMIEWAESLTPTIHTHSIKINGNTYSPTEDECINQSRQKCDKTILVLWGPKEK